MNKTIRVLVVDDQPIIHRVFAATFRTTAESAMQHDQNQLSIQMESAYQSEEAIALTTERAANNQFFDLAFVDLHMPPGAGGIETIKGLWKADPLLPIVICTAHSDVSGSDLINELGVSDRLQILKKPFDAIEVQQLALTISKRRTLETESRRRMDELDNRVRERTSELLAAKEHAESAQAEAEKANQLKSQFLANMSHELRTPLNGVLGMLDVLRGTSLTTRQDEFARISQTSARSLLAIINDILDYSKIEAQQLTLESVPFNLTRMLEEIASLGAAQVANSDVEVVLHYSSALSNGIVGDPLRLRQVLTNLLNNALKFTTTGHVILEARSVKDDVNGTSRIRFAVRDTGIGIPMDKIGDIFNKFTQADGSTTREFGGTGLGLAISSHLVELMDAKIEVTSTLGEGSEFSFEAVLETVNLPEPKAIYPELKRSRILVVDDLSLNREILQAQLELDAQFVQTAGSGHEALELLRTTNPPFDVVVTDYQMPQMNGQTLGEEIRKENLSQQPKLIMLSSNCASISQEQLADIGFDDFLIKPASRTILVTAIRGALGAEVTDVESETDDSSKTQFNTIRVLVADDNQINQVVAENCLLNLGCESVELCDNGQQAIDAVVKGDFDIVFMDCYMPVMDGYEASRLIRKLPPPKCNIPIVALTANALSGDKDVCLEAGMDDHLPKPIEPHQIQKVLRTLTQYKPHVHSEAGHTTGGSGISR